MLLIHATTTAWNELALNGGGFECLFNDLSMVRKAYSQFLSSTIW